MNVTIFGANGRVGKLVVRDALANGHSVVAFIYGKNPFDTTDRLQVVQGDIYDTNIIKKALEGNNIVLSTLGSWGTPKKDILSTGMKNIIPAMTESGIKRIITLTGAGCNPKSVKPSLVEKINRLPLLLVAPKVLNDAEMHMQMLIDSELDWTILRSPVMNSRGDSDNYKVVNSCPMPWSTINRESVAKAMVELINTKEHINKALFVVRK